MRVLVSLTENCGTNTGRSDCSWSTETTDTGLLYFSFLVYPYFFPFFLLFCLLVVPNMYDTKRGTSYFRSINSGGMTQSFSSMNMELGCR